ncbi:MAG: protein-disulfide reductase DsbD family protein [Bryobacterales bacterium]|nr:protein-disulfide reductase DsbD family protein [Bryobacterales bacterium]
MRLAVRLFLGGVLATGLWAGGWSAPVEATDRSGTALVTCRARLAGGHLVVELRAKPGWHVYAMDNERRAKEALAGRMSLGVEESTEVVVQEGLRVTGPWLQSEPQDFSQPELRWYSYGFEGIALLAAPVERTGGDTGRVSVRAQACDAASCIRVDADLAVPLADQGVEAFSTAGLVEVRRQ